MEAQREGICALILLESTIFSREASFYVFLTWDLSSKVHTFLPKLMLTDYGAFPSNDDG